MAGSTTIVDETQVLEALREVFDPEIPVNIVDLGLVYEVNPTPGRVDVKMTLTAIGCPMAPEVMNDVRDRLLLLERRRTTRGSRSVYDPPWTPERMTRTPAGSLGLI